MKNEEKIKIFAQYLGNYFKAIDEVRMLDLTQLKNMITNTITLESKGYKLMLKPLRMITEEHAAVLVKMSRQPFDKPKFKTAADYIVAVKVALCEGDDNFLLEYQEADYLREKGYAVPYKGESLFDLGIAIEVG